MQFGGCLSRLICRNDRAGYYARELEQCQLAVPEYSRAEPKNPRVQAEEP
jgi:hypothetical protein